jgi:hypothetical protein
VPKTEHAARDFYDVWLQDLAPSESLLKQSLGPADERSWNAFTRRYRSGPRRRSALSFFNLEPEVSGSPTAGPASGAPAFVFDTWLGDDVIRAYPAVLVTTPVKRALLALPDPTGFEITRARVRRSPFFRQFSPGKRLPRFWAIQVRGQAGRDDMGLTEAGVLVVSRRVLDVLLDFRIGRSVLAQHSQPD